MAAAGWTGIHGNGYTPVQVNVTNTPARAALPESLSLVSSLPLFPNNVAAQHTRQFGCLAVPQGGALEFARKNGDAGTSPMDHHRRPDYLVYGPAFLHDMGLEFVSYVHIVFSL